MPRMNEYIFRMPADTPPLTFTALRERCQRQNYANSGIGKIGTTVTLYHMAWPDRDGVAEEYIQFRLYGLMLARIYADRVEFTDTDDPHMATTAWLAQIVVDNHLGGGVFRIRRHAADGPGPQVPRGRAGLLAINGDRDKPVVGASYPVTRKET